MVGSSNRRKLLTFGGEFKPYAPMPPADQHATAVSADCWLSSDERYVVVHRVAPQKKQKTTTEFSLNRQQGLIFLIKFDYTRSRLL